jgi:5'(3')-deoxyribonucleotidase
MNTLKPHIVYVDMDDVICNFTSAYNCALQQIPSIKHPQSQYGFFANLTPKDGAIEAVKALIQSPAFEPYVLTAPSTRNPFSYTEKRVWIEKYFGYEFVEKLIICSNKGLLKGDYLIDDHVNGKGQENFEGKLIHFGSKEFPHWNALKEQLGL